MSNETKETQIALILLQSRITIELNRIQGEAIANFRTLARSTGQNMRVDRVMK